MERRLLIATTKRWLSSARLAIGFQELGWSVSAVCPAGHPMERTQAVSTTYRFRELRPGASLRRAIRAARADLVIPVDDLAAAHLHQLARKSGTLNDPEAHALSSLLRRSLGDPRSYGLVVSRSRFAALAREQGLRVPRTSSEGDEAALAALLGEEAYPLVLKADATSGGEGVRVVHSREEALRAFRQLRRPLGTRAVLWQLVLDRDFNVLLPWLGRRARTVSVQQFVDGRDANIAVACWEGEVLASVAVEALHTRRRHGPSAVVRVVDAPAMEHAARTLVRALGLSGLCGFDFVLDGSTGEPFLLEINGRATPTCHLSLGPGRDLLAALCTAAARAAGDPGAWVPARPAITANPVIALFPLAWEIDPASTFLEGAYQDLPEGEPELVRAGLAEPWLPTRTQWHKFWSRLVPPAPREPVPAPERPQ